MDLAFVTGRGPRVTANLEGRCPLVRDEDVVVFGRRDAEDAEAHGSQRIEDTAIRVMDLSEVRQRGAANASATGIEHLSRPDMAGFWCTSTPMYSTTLPCRPLIIACPAGCRGTSWREPFAPRPTPEGRLVLT
jgi:hypothetical protein